MPVMDDIRSMSEGEAIETYLMEYENGDEEVREAFHELGITENDVTLWVYLNLK